MAIIWPLSVPYWLACLQHVAFRAKNRFTDPGALAVFALPVEERPLILSFNRSNPRLLFKKVLSPDVPQMAFDCRLGNQPIAQPLALSWSRVQSKRQALGKIIP